MSTVDTFGTRTALQVGGRSVQYFSLSALEKAGFPEVARLPFSLKILLENLLRHEDGRFVKKADIEALAATVSDSDGVVLVPAFTGLGAPHWDAHARALLIGMTRGTTRAHIARAALDAIAWQVADVGNAMAEDAGLALAQLRVDGGASANDLLMQTQADVLNVPIVRPRLTESTAYGAAQLAALGVGLFADRAALQSAWQPAAHFTPHIDDAHRATQRQRWHRAIERALAWAD